MHSLVRFLPVALAALLPAGPALAGPLGNNLADEACELVARDDLSPEAGLPPDATIRCGGRPTGGVVYSKHAGGGGNVEAQRQSIANQHRNGRAGRLLAQAMDCRDGSWVGDDATLLALPCTLKDGGWPHLVVVHIAKGIMTVADGPPSNWPVLQAAVLGAPPEKLKSQLTEELQSIWGGPVVLATAGDLTRFKQLLRDGRSANGLRKFRDAEEQLRQALEIQTKLLGENNTAIADTLMDLALNVSNQARFDEAQALFRRAEPIVQRSPNEADRARFATYLGLEAANRGDFAAARQFARAAVESWRKLASGGNSLAVFSSGQDTSSRDAERGELAMALNLEARMALRNDDPVGASALATEALLLINQAEGLPKWWRSDVLLTLGEVRMAEGRLSAAETFLNNALKEREQVFGAGPATIAVQTALGRAYQSEGMNTSAIVTFRDAFKAARALPNTGELFNSEELMPFGAAITAYAATLTDEAAIQGLYAEAFDAFQLVRSGVIERTIAQAAAKMATDDPAIADLIDRFQTAQRERDVAKIELSHEQSLPDDQRSARAEAALQKRIADLEASAADLRQQIDAQFPDYASLATPKPLDLVEVRKRLGDREGLVSFLIGRERAFVQLIKRSGIWIAPVPESRDSLQSAVTALRRALEIQGGSVNEFDMTRANELYVSLFGGIEKHLAGLDHLIVVPSGPLASLPFGLLVLARPLDNDYSKARWLTQQIPISHAPSIHAFYTLRGARAAQAPAKPLLAFGDPILLGGAPNKGEESALAQAGQMCRPEGPMDRQTLLSMTRLPETADELRKVAQILRADSSTVFLGDAASEPALRAQKLDDYRVLYFATHGLLPGELKCQAEPGLVLTPPAEQASKKASDGLLEASEIAQLRINADLVVLSACNTAGGGGKFGGEALSGLAEAFFHAGARSLVVSHWQVPSAATAQLMSGMFAFLGPQLATGSAPALRDSQTKLIANPKTAHPFFWAAFVVVGDGLAASTPATASAADAPNPRAAS